jgi:hypothetical protein
MGLPAIFRGSDLTMRNDWSSRRASHYLYLWQRRNLVAALGGKSDVYANMLACRDPNWEEALLKAMPTAAVIGLEALRRAGWITQIPTLATVAVSKAMPTHKVKHFAVSTKTAGWFERSQPGLEPSQAPGVALPCMHPAWALADLAATHGLGVQSGVWPDDLDADAITDQDRTQWRLACHAYSLNEATIYAQWPELRDMLSM